MTKPIQEPTNQRTLSGHTWGISQLARRPAPVSAGGCPCALDTALMHDGVTGSGTSSISDNTKTDIIFEEISISTGSTAFAIRSAVPTARPLKCVADGWYLFFYNFSWSGANFSDVRSYYVEIGSGADNAGSVFLVQSMSSPFIDSEFDGTFGPVHIRGASLSDQYFRVGVQHSSGGPKSVTGVEVTGLFLGPDMDERWPAF